MRFSKSMIWQRAIIRKLSEVRYKLPLRYGIFDRKNAQASQPSYMPRLPFQEEILQRN